MLRPLLIFVALCVIAIIAGVILGGQSSPPEVDVEKPDTPTEEAAEPETAESPPAVEESPEPTVSKVNASAWLDLLSPESPAAVERELTLAMDQGVVQFIVPVPMPWDESASVDLQAIADVAKDHADVQFVFDLDVNPPAAWYETQPQAAVPIPEGDPLPNIHDAAWEEAAASGFERLLEAIEQAGLSDTVQGYVLHGLDQGHWLLPQSTDFEDTVGREAFQRWLTQRYGSEEDALAAWDTEDIAATVEAIAPSPPEADAPIFAETGESRARLDYARFQSESVVRTIESLSRQLKGVAGRNARVYVPYGFTLELPGVHSGHLSLERLLASDIDGIVCPLSEQTRAMGQSGAYRVPVNSARYALKTVLYVDNTPTGLNGTETKKEDWPFQSIAEVFERNAAAAMAAGMRPVWSDAQGSGAVNDDRLWQRFGALARAHSARDARVATLGGQFRRYDVRPEGYVTLTVVIDEESFFYTNNAPPVLRMIEQVRRAALEAGVSVHFTLMSDVLADRAIPSPVYLFANAFHIDASDRDRLHAIMERDNATAIWMYAPGYHSASFDVDNVSATVAMDIDELDDAPEGGSTYALVGRWIARDTTYSMEGLPPARFAIDAGDEEDVSVIAKYAGSDDVSVAATSPNGEWTSIFLADPALPTPLLRELLTILELSIIADSTAEGDTYYFANDMIAIHAAEEGPRSLPLQWQYDVIDDVDWALAEIGAMSKEDVTGWPAVRNIVFSIGAGETRIFRLTPNSAPTQ